MNAFAGAAAFAQSVPVRSIPKDYKEDLFYREDWLGEPWRKPETAVLIHGNDESSTEWYAWVPRMGREYRLKPVAAPVDGRLVRGRCGQARTDDIDEVIENVHHLRVLRSFGANPGDHR